MAATELISILANFNSLSSIIISFAISFTHTLLITLARFPFCLQLSTESVGIQIAFVSSLRQLMLNFIL